jgi:acetyltransferase-like isoleucine patch superfamily enzyme
MNSILKIKRKLLIISALFGKKHYMKKVISLYKKTNNVIFNGIPKYIDRNASLDCFGKGKIYIGSGSVITANSLILTHDYSIDCGLVSISENDNNYESIFYKDVVVGDNCFIGQRAIILPGVVIGNNCIIGSGCVVSKNIPDDSIVVGNPCRIIANTKEWAKNKKLLHEYVNGDKRL